MHLRSVRKFIVLIKATTIEKTSVLLNYMSEDWGMSLFPNCNVPEKGEDDKEYIAQLLSSRLGIDKSQISVNVDRNDLSRTRSIEKATADSGKAKKYGGTALYTFHYATVSLKVAPSEMRREHFKLKGDCYVWRSLSDLKADASVRVYNHDVLEFLSETFDRSLAVLTESDPPNFTCRM